MLTYNAVKALMVHCLQHTTSHVLGLMHRCSPHHVSGCTAAIDSLYALNRFEQDLETGCKPGRQGMSLSPFT